MEKNEIDPYRDYFEMMSSEREANMNRQGYKRMKSDFLQEQGMDPLLIDLDYAYDAGNEANTDILPAVSKKEDGSVTDDILLDTNTREGMAWAAASKVFYDAFSFFVVFILLFLIFGTFFGKVLKRVSKIKKTKKTICFCWFSIKKQ